MRKIGGWGNTGFLPFLRGAYLPKKWIKAIPITGIFAMFLFLSLAGCDKEIDEHYKRPDWLESPVYDILQAKGNFKMFLSCVDKTLYSQVLKGSGNYTVFTPNDEAFGRFLSEKGYSSVDDIPLTELNKIVGYSLVYNKYETEHLGDAQISGQWNVGSSIKKRTSYYKTIYKEEVNGKEEWVIDYATEGSGIRTPYKYIPIFTDTYFSTNRLDASDYNIFYPQKEYSGLNVLDGSILNKDIYAENGIIHEVNSVLYPLENLDELLKKPENSSFKNYLEYKIDGTALFVSYQEDKTLTETYKKVYPDENITSLYTKQYITLPYSPNVEAYQGKNSGNTEQDGYTMFIPNNSAVDNFVSGKLLKYATSFNELPTDVLTYFLSAHMADGMVWPSNFERAQNTNGEFLNGKGDSGLSFAESGMLAKTMASNGIMYNIDHVIKSKYFETVYSEILLNPDYSLLNAALNNFYKNSLLDDLMKSPITGYVEENVIILIPSNELLKEDFSYNDISLAFSFADGATHGTINAEDRLKRLIRMCIFKRIENDEVHTAIKDFEGSPALGYDGYGYAVNDYGDMIRFKDGQIQAVGNILDDDVVTAIEVATLNNGKVFAIDKLLQFSPRVTKSASNEGWEDQKLYTFIDSYVKQNPDAQVFKNYLDKTIYTATDGSIAGISTSGFYTILIPTNDVMQKAQQDGYLPALSYVEGLQPDSLTKATNFINSCFLSGTVVSDDGVARIMPGNYEKINLGTVYKVNEAALDLIAEKTTIEVSKKSNGNLVFTPKNIELGLTVQVEGITGGNSSVNVVRGIDKSNYMGPRAVIHQIDNYYVFKVNLPK
ncbi:hypothetical protein EZS27_010066 [termite gut metagenome]|uniref:FAS1 domain-containing protein n=1 Tax=termite gut metagenome TaxID=433724 RepID=A0A5J4S8J4_9ZZZZ